MDNVIIGTAGHVDHGKTSLIKQLTGIDADRLEEEKKRGITIELGFADLVSESGDQMGIIDVPGHEKFINNMLAGIGGIDIALLVVAADEGIMPQTREHLDIINSLSIEKGIIALTKIDMVEEDWLEMVIEDVKDTMKGSLFEGAKIVPVSSKTGENVDLLREELFAMRKECKEKFTDPELLRIPIDRVFSISGFGTVITGTLMEGTIKVGQKVEIYPTGEMTKVRTLQVHGKEVEEAYAGQRTAVNLANIKKEDLERGYIVSYPDQMTTTKMIDVWIESFSEGTRTILDGSRVHFHYGSAQAIGKVVLLEEELLAPGESGLAQLRFEEEVAIKKGDHFVLRFFSPVESIGGGWILDANPRKHKRGNEKTIESLIAKKSGDKNLLVEQLVKDQQPALASLDTVIKQGAITREEGKKIVGKLVEDHALFLISEEQYCHSTYFEIIKEKVGKLLGDFHKENPITKGMDKAQLRSKMGEVLYIRDGKGVQNLLTLLTEQGEVVDHGEVISSKNFVLTLSKDQEVRKEEILGIYKEAGFQMPSADELPQGSKEDQDIIEYLVEEGNLIRLESPYFMDKTTFDQEVAFVRDYIKENKSIPLSMVRDHMGASRKYAMMFLQVLDEQKITMLVGEERVLI